MENKRYYLLCEDSITGIFTGIYQAYLKKLPLEQVHLVCGEAPIVLFAELTRVEPDVEMAVKVERTLRREMGSAGFSYLQFALASYEEEKADAIFKLVVDCITNKSGTRVWQNLSNDYVNKAHSFARNCQREWEHFRGFLRFMETKQGILAAKFTPKNRQIELLMPHFADRFPQENFLIYDATRKYCGIHPAGKEWFLVIENLDEQFSEEGYGAQKQYEELFRVFCDTIAIKERTNKSLQRNMLPLRFRDHMTEFQQMESEKSMQKIE